MMDSEPLFRLAAFFGVLGLLATWEVLAPRRQLTADKVMRWVANLSVVVLNTVMLRALFATGAVGVAVAATQERWGVLNHLTWPTWLEVFVAVIALDFVLYLQHVMFHAVPTFWRFHMMHHADLDCDVTTGVRFHPIEVILSLVIKLTAVVVLGAPPAAVLSFEILLNATSMFNHSNVSMPVSVDRVLRWLVVTPDMHRIHHSIDPRETNRNFGFNLPWWDHLLGTYLANPAQGHETMTLGLAQFRDPKRLNFTGILALPFAGEPGRYPLGRQG
jgi:sterol desaturase/sphingolipid hydroxylase (fatty acid hydroxylase superfamily)